MTKEELLKKTNHSLTMKQLREFVKNNKDISDKAPVIVERVEDSYFKEKPWHDGSIINGWGVLKVEGFHYHSALDRNKEMQEEAERRERGEEPEYGLENPLEFTFSEEDLEDIKEQFYQPHCITTDKEVVYIYSHY